MITFKQYSVQQLEENIIRDMTKEMLPKKVLHFLKRSLHKDKYIAVLKLQHKMLKDATRKISVHTALVKAAETYGIDPREMQKVMDKETRYA